MKLARIDRRCGVLIVTLPLPQLALRAIARLRDLWIWATYWKVACADCGGTGICQQILNGAPSPTPHSCCGQCDRREAPFATMPPRWQGPLFANGNTVLGDGIMWRRPWSRAQTHRPSSWRT